MPAWIAATSPAASGLLKSTPSTPAAKHEPIWRVMTGMATPPFPVASDDGIGRSQAQVQPGALAAELVSSGAVDIVARGGLPAGGPQGESACRCASWVALDFESPRCAWAATPSVGPRI